MVAAAGILLMNWRRKLDDEEDSEVKEEQLAAVHEFII